MMHIEGQLNTPTFVTEKLAVAGAGMLSNSHALTENNIAAIVNVTNSVVITDPQREVLSIPIDDSVTTDIRKYFQAFFTFMYAAEEKNHSVLICCQYGMSRSVSFAIAWLMKKTHDEGELVSLDDILEKFTAKRPMIAPNPGFIRQLKKLQNELNAGLPQNSDRFSLSYSFKQSHLTPKFTNSVSPREVMVLEQVSLSFYHNISRNEYWKKLLKQEYSLDSAQLELLERYGISYKSCYFALVLLRKRELLNAKTKQEVFIANIIGMLAPPETITTYLEQNPEAEFHVVCGMIYRNRMQTLFALRDSIDLHKLDRNQQNYLFYALHPDNIQSFTCLSLHLNHNQVSVQGNTLFHMAARSGNLEAFKQLVQHARAVTPKTPNKMKMNALHIAIQYQKDTIVKFIVDNDLVDPENKNTFGKTANEMAAEKNIDINPAFSNTNLRSFT